MKRMQFVRPKPFILWNCWKTTTSINAVKWRYFRATSSLYCIAALIGLQRDGWIGSYPTVTKALIEIHVLGNKFQERVGFVAKLGRNAFPGKGFLGAKRVSLSHREKHRHLDGEMNRRRFRGRTQWDMMTGRQSCHSCFAWVCLPLKRIQINAAAVGTGVLLHNRDC